jgi:type VI secretion system protein
MPRTSFLDKFHTGRVREERHGLASVMRNVQAMLSTQKGYGYFLEGFGLGGYVDNRSKLGLARALGEEMQAELRQHEPRLEGVEVELRGRDSALWLHYELRARLNGKPCRMRILVDTTTGQLRVEPREEE